MQKCLQPRRKSRGADDRLYTIYEPRDINVAVSDCIQPYQKQITSYFCMRVRCTLLNRQPCASSGDGFYLFFAPSLTWQNLVICTFPRHMYKAGGTLARLLNMALLLVFLLFCRYAGPNVLTEVDFRHQGPGRGIIWPARSWTSIAASTHRIEAFVQYVVQATFVQCPFRFSFEQCMGCAALLNVHIQDVLLESCQELLEQI